MMAKTWWWMWMLAVAATGACGGSSERTGAEAKDPDAGDDASGGSRSGAGGTTEAVGGSSAGSTAGGAGAQTTGATGGTDRTCRPGEDCNVTPIDPPNPMRCGGVECAANESCCLAAGRCFDPAV